MSTIAQNLQTIATAKADIATSVNNKGGNITSSTPLSAYSAAIDAIPSGGGGGVPDWSEIGYSGAPQSVLDAFDYSKTIYDNWDATKINLDNKFNNNSELVYMPLVDTSNATRMYQMFNGCSRLTSIPLLDTSKVTTMESMFNNCLSLTTVPRLNTSACTSMSYMFNGCSGLTTVPQLNTSACTNMASTFRSCSGITTVPQFDTSKVTTLNGTFYGCSGLTEIPQLNTSACTNMALIVYNCSSLKKIAGLDFTSVTNIASMFGYGDNTSIKHMLFKNLGTPSGMTSYDFSKATNWGVADSTYTDARQSLVDSLLTYSYDRATAGYSTCTIKLYSNSKNQLTAQEITDIEAKGYTITT